MLKLGKIDYLNVWPIYFAMEHGLTPNPCRITARCPSELNVMMCRGDLDVSAVSSVMYARHPQLFTIVPGLAVACDGPVHSVLLLSKKPLEALEGEDILLTSHSDTSVVLLKVLVEKYWGLRGVRYHRRALREALSNGSSPLAFLAIGDEALVWGRHPDYPYRWDLAEVWNTWTGLPFVFALWVVRREVATRAPQLVHEVVRCLWASKAWGLRHLDVLCREAAPLGILDADGLCRYFQTFRYDLQETALAGLSLFYRQMVAVGDIATFPVLDVWAEPETDVESLWKGHPEGESERWAARL